MLLLSLFIETQNSLLSFKCSLVGATVIVVGFYSVLWGKFKDYEMRSLESKGKQTPLLKENSSEDT